MAKQLWASMTRRRAGWGNLRPEASQRAPPKLSPAGAPSPPQGTLGNSEQGKGEPEKTQGQGCLEVRWLGAHCVLPGADGQVTRKQ